MNKLIITEPGWKGYTGDFGGVAFKDGVSVEPVPDMVASSLAGLIRFRTEKGSCPSPAGKLAENRLSGAPVARRMRTMQERLDEEAKAAEENGEDETEIEAQEEAEKLIKEAEEKAAAEKAAKQKAAEEKVAALREQLKGLEEESLKATAKEGGIAALREIADKLNESLPEAGQVKSNSIPGLIEKISNLRNAVLGEA